MVYIVLSVIASLHVSRALVLSLNAFQEFIVWGFSIVLLYQVVGKQPQED